MKPSPALLLALSLTACGARTGLDASSLSSEPPDANTLGVSKSPAYCTGESAAFIYAVTAKNVLLRFNPPHKTFETIGTLDCNPSAGVPSALAVAHDGTVFVIFDQTPMVRLSTTNASCSLTSFDGHFGGSFSMVGLAFSSDADGLGETLFISGFADAGDDQLGSVDTTTFATQLVGTFTPSSGHPTLAGTGDGRLFDLSTTGADDQLAQVDKTTAAALTELQVAMPPFWVAWPFAFWGGDLYFFFAQDPSMPTSTTVGRLHVADGSLDPSYATLPDQQILGAGASTCAPLQ